MTGVPDIVQALNLVKGFDDQIQVLWNVYIAVISLYITILLAKNTLPHLLALVGVFIVFAVGNTIALSRLFAARDSMLDHADSLLGPAQGNAASPHLAAVAQALRGPTSWLEFHLPFDICVLVVLVFIWWWGSQSGPASTVRSN